MQQVHANVETKLINKNIYLIMFLLKLMKRTTLECKHDLKKAYHLMKHTLPKETYVSSFEATLIPCTNQCANELLYSCFLKSLDNGSTPKYLLIEKAFINNKYLKVLTVFSSILTGLGCLNSVVNYFFFTEVFCDLVTSVNYDVVKDGKLI